MSLVNAPLFLVTFRIADLVNHAGLNLGIGKDRPDGFLKTFQVVNTGDQEVPNAECPRRPG
jgi:hypothetical protein